MNNIEMSKILISRLNSLCKEIAFGEYKKIDTEGLFEMTSSESYPEELSQLAESFGMMMVKVEAREYSLEQTIDELEKAKVQLEDYSHNLEDMVAERTEELSIANSELKRLADLDGLTRIANRRIFDEHIHEEWQRALRESAPLSLIMCDVDHFKLFNDTYGHQPGDDCLRKIARVLQSCMKRAGDLAARYGGEEFATILPNTDRKNAFQLAEMIRSSIEGLKIEHKNNSASDYVTISLGVSSIIPKKGLSPKTLIEQADRALYIAKRDLGRNACALWREENLDS